MPALSKNNALIVVDVQNGFCPNGQLAVPYGDEIVPIINRLAHYFSNIVITQDWHPLNHISFAENHPNKRAFDQIQVSYGPQILWPTHCVQGTHDAELHPDLNLPQAQLIIRKGFHTDIDSYSAFLEADQTTSTGLDAYLKQRKIETVYVVGLATDFCVAATAIHACELGFKTFVIEDACRAINLNGSLQQAWDNMQSVGVIRTNTLELGKLNIYD